MTCYLRPLCSNLRAKYLFLKNQNNNTQYQKESAATTTMDSPFNCKKECLLRDLYECKKDYLSTNNEKITILAHQVAESQNPEKIIELNFAQEKQTSKLQETNKLLHCLETGCNQCYPETGTHYDSEVELSEEEDESEEEKGEEALGLYKSDCASKDESHDSSPDKN